MFDGEPTIDPQKALLRHMGRGLSPSPQIAGGDLAFGVEHGIIANEGT
jgi:hypothetical protein